MRAIIPLLLALGCARLESWPSHRILPRVGGDPQDLAMIRERHLKCGFLYRWRVAEIDFAPRDKPEFYRGWSMNCTRGLIPWWRCSSPVEGSWLHSSRNEGDIWVSDDVEPNEATSAINRVLDALDLGIPFYTRRWTRDYGGPIRSIERAKNAIQWGQEFSDCQFIVGTSPGFPTFGRICVPPRGAQPIRGIHILSPSHECMEAGEVAG